MTNFEINAELGREIRGERKITNKILHLIILAEDRKIHLERGFSSLHNWLVVEHKYSAAAANRRIQAARLLRAVPGVEQKLVEGSVNLTTLAQTQSMIRVQEMKSKKRVCAEKVVSKIEYLSSMEVAQTLMKILPENISSVKRESVTAIDPETQRLSVNLSNEAMADLQRIKELLSHAIPTAEAGAVLARVFKEFLKRHDPVQKSHSAAVSQRATRATILRRDRGSCTYKDPVTGRICGEKFRIERDHIWPKANGGDDSVANGRALCRAHNQLMSEKVLGRERAHRWQRGRQNFGT